MCHQQAEEFYWIDVPYVQRAEEVFCGSISRLIRVQVGAAQGTIWDKECRNRVYTHGE